MSAASSSYSAADARSSCSSSSCSSLSRPCRYSPSIRFASPSTRARNALAAPSSSDFSNPCSRAPEVEVLVLQGVRELVHEGGRRRRRQLVAADPDHLVLVGVEADDARTGQLIARLEEIDLAVEQADCPEQPLVVLDVCAVLLGQVAVVLGDLLAEGLVAQEPDGHGVLEVKAARVLDERGEGADLRVPALQPRGVGLFGVRRLGRALALWARRRRALPGPPSRRRPCRSRPRRDR